jgi:hypothetical protein
MFFLGGVFGFGERTRSFHRICDRFCMSGNNGGICSDAAACADRSELVCNAPGGFDELIVS